MQGCTLGFSTIPDALETSKLTFGASFGVFSRGEVSVAHRRPTPLATAGAHLGPVRSAELDGDVEILFRREHGEIYVGATLCNIFHFHFPPPWLAIGEATAARRGDLRLNITMQLCLSGYLGVRYEFERGGYFGPRVHRVF